MTKTQHTTYLSVRDRMRQMLDLPNAEIAAKLGCSVRTVQDNRRYFEGPSREAGNGNWTDERIATLTQLWADGLSASQIGARLGISRNAVIGKRMRLGLSGRLTTSRKPSNRKVKLRPPSQPVRPKPSPLQALKTDGLPIPTPAETDIPRVSWQALNEDGQRHCKWPCVADVSGIPQDQPLYCGAEPVPGSPYCRAHSLRAFSFVPVRQRPVSGEKVVPIRAKKELEVA